MFDYENYLLSELNQARVSLGFEDYKIKIAVERSFKMPSKPDGKLLFFVIKNLTGSYIFDTIHTQPVQIICYSEINSMTVAMQVLDYFVKNHNNTSFYDDEDNLIKQNYDTVVTLRPMIPSEVGFKASLYCYGTYVVNENIADIKNLTYMGELVPYTSLGIGYSAVVNTTKVSGEELSTSLKQEAGLVLSITIANYKNNSFCEDVNDVMMGINSGNMQFKFSFDLNTQCYIDLPFILTSATFSTDRENAPTMQLTFTR